MKKTIKAKSSYFLRPKSALRPTQSIVYTVISRRKIKKGKVLLLIKCIDISRRTDTRNWWKESTFKARIGQGLLTPLTKSELSKMLLKGTLTYK